MICMLILRIVDSLFLARNAIVVFLAALLGVGIKHLSWFHDK